MLTHARVYACTLVFTRTRQVKGKLQLRQKQVDSMQDKLSDLEREVSKLKVRATPLIRTPWTS